MPSLLSIGTNPKTLKGNALGYWTAILHLSPAQEANAMLPAGHSLNAFTTMCPHSTPGCRAACLHTAGRGGLFPSIPKARARKTISFLTDREAFMLKLSQEIGRFTVKALKAGFKPCVRLNGTSDVQWEKVLLSGRTLMAWHPEVSFYDYTKHPGRFQLPQNYSLTYSLAETERSRVQALSALVKGRNVAVVFDTKKGQALPTHFDGFRVIDGDVSDLRFLDGQPSGQGVIIGLRAKGRAKTDSSGFVQKAGAA